MTDATRYPLSWPLGWPRTPTADRQRSDFSEAAMVERSNYGKRDDGTWGRITKTVKGTKRVTMPTARERLTDQLGRLGAEDPLLSTNVELTSYGLPRAGRSEPTDPGVAVYFQLHGKDRVLACDRWATVAENIAALAAHIDAIRRVDRYGVGTLDQAFAGYDALPPPSADNRPPWRGVLGIKPETPVTREIVSVFYRSACKRAGNDQGALLQLNLARDAALQEIGS